MGHTTTPSGSGWARRGITATPHPAATSDATAGHSLLRWTTCGVKPALAHTARTIWEHGSRGAELTHGSAARVSSRSPSGRVSGCPSGRTASSGVDDA